MKQDKRGHWSGKIGFILAAAGSAIGLGNLWKFPYITLENEGGGFVLIYLVAICIVGLPIMLSEILLGKITQKDPVGAFRSLEQPDSTAFIHYHREDQHGTKRSFFPWYLLGVLGVLTGFIILSYYTVIAGWTLEYSLAAMMGKFTGITAEGAGNFFGDFLNHPYKQVVWLFIFMSLTGGIVYFGVKDGIEKATKVLMPVLFCMILGLMIYSLMLDGAGKALKFLFNPSFKNLTRHSILEALGHAFFTLSLGMGAMITYGSYLRKKEDLVTCGLTITVLDTLIALMACLMMYPILFTFNIEVGSGGIGILFTTLPATISQFTGGRFLLTAFYLLIAFAALSSTISLMEVVVCYVVDELKIGRHSATLGAIVVTFLLGIPSALCTGSKQCLAGLTLLRKGEKTLNFLDSFDYLASNWLLPVGGMFIALFAGWCLSRETITAEFKAHGYPGWFIGLYIFLVRFVSPVLVFIVLLNKIGIIG